MGYMYLCVRVRVKGCLLFRGDIPLSAHLNTHIISVEPSADRGLTVIKAKMRTQWISDEASSTTCIRLYFKKKSNNLQCKRINFHKMCGRKCVGVHFCTEMTQTQ